MKFFHSSKSAINISDERGASTLCALWSPTQHEYGRYLYPTWDAARQMSTGRFFKKVILVSLYMAHKSSYARFLVASCRGSAQSARGGGSGMRYGGRAFLAACLTFSCSRSSTLGQHLVVQQICTELPSHRIARLSCVGRTPRSPPPNWSLD